MVRQLEESKISFLLLGIACKIISYEFSFNQRLGYNSSRIINRQQEELCLLLQEGVQNGRMRMKGWLFTFTLKVSIQCKSYKVEAPQNYLPMNKRLAQVIIATEMKMMKTFMLRICVSSDEITNFSWRSKTA